MSLSDNFLEGVRKVSLAAMIAAGSSFVYGYCSAQSNLESPAYAQAIRLEQRIDKLESELADCVPNDYSNLKVAYGCVDLKNERDEIKREYESMTPELEKMMEDLSENSLIITCGFLASTAAIPFYFLSSVEIQKRKLLKQ